jgi:site-specific recombinase XerD
LVSIGVIHRLKGQYLDTKHPSIIENIMGIKRRKGSKQKGKKPLLINNLKQIINIIDENKTEEIKKFRDRSILLIGFSGGFRRNEIISLDYEDLDFVTEGLKINLKRSKTDQFGEGSIKALPYFDNSQYCPVISLKKWIEVSSISSGPLFRRFSKGSKLTENRLTDQTVALLIKKYLKLTGIENKNYSGHSLRSGFATSAAESGADERSIMAMTGHKSTEMVRRYIKEANLFKNNALNKIKI